MFLFTTSAPRESAPETPVAQAIRRGAERTGVSFDYLIRTAQRESALDPDARARTSSATGLFQFIDQTWLATMRAEGPKHGLGEQAQAITQGSDGRLGVADPAMREQIMALRRDPTVAATMAGAFTQRNREELSTALGREPNAGELYTAHVLGARGATSLLAAMRSDPERVAARDFPEAAAANRGIFFDRAGRARSVSEVFAVLTAQHADVQRAAASAPESAASPPGRPGLLGLFSTNGGEARGPVSDAVSRFWTTPRARGVAELATAPAAERFFPSAGGTLAAPAAEADGQSRAVMAPLPPERPAGLGGPPAAEPRRSNRPLDLNAFVRSGGP